MLLDFSCLFSFSLCTSSMTAATLGRCKRGPNLGGAAVSGACSHLDISSARPGRAGDKLTHVRTKVNQHPNTYSYYCLILYYIILIYMIYRWMYMLEAYNK